MTNGINKRISSRQRGQSLVEFALSALILFMLLFGVLEISRLAFVVSDINNGARESVHYAALHPEATVATLTQQIAPKLIFISPADLNIALDCPTCSGPGSCLPPACYTAMYQPLTITVGYTLTTGVSFPGFSGGIPIQTQVTTRRER